MRKKIGKFLVPRQPAPLQLSNLPFFLERPQINRSNMKKIKFGSLTFQSGDTGEAKLPSKWAQKIL